MPLSKEQREAIGKEIATGIISSTQAVNKYNISRSAAQLYAQQYRKEHNIPTPKPGRKQNDNVIPVANTKLPKSEILPSSMEQYMEMSKEELINELIKAKVNEARAKKGYEVKGDGQNKEFISLNNKNLK